MSAKCAQVLLAEAGAAGYRRGLETDALLIDPGSQMTFGVIFGDGENALKCAARLALCWNMHDDLVKQLRAIVGRRNPDARGGTILPSQLEAAWDVLAKLDGAT